jgi:integrase
MAAESKGKRVLGRLTALDVSRAKTPGLRADGGGLYLQTTAATARSWIFRYRPPGRKTPRDLGLGSLATVSLAQARELARRAREILATGRDPIEAKREATAKARLDAARNMTFQEAAETYVADHKVGWSERHADQWASSMEMYGYPILGKLAVADVDVSLVLKVLNPIWTTKPETGSRVRSRVESVLDWAKARGFRSGDNPARWRGNLDHLLPAKTKVRAVRHYPALPYDDIGTFMVDLRKEEGVAARALEFAILTASRTSEVTGAIPIEFDRAKALWTVPPERIKARREHRVPLTTRALEILEEMAPLAGAYVFPGRKGKALGVNALLGVINRLGYSVTTHGFRSSFKDWSIERTNYPSDMSEVALAHVVPDKTLRAYMRSDMLEKRRRMMADWAKFCARPSRVADVISINAKAPVRARE